MSIKLRYPDLMTPSQQDPIKRVQNYLYQMVDELNIALVSVQAQDSNANGLSHGPSKPGSASEKDAQSSFNDIKSLIIKSADIVNAYYDIINKRLEGVYVAESDFGTFLEESVLDIEVNSKSISQYFKDVQQLIDVVGELEQTLIAVTANIKTGLLYYNDPDDEDNYIEEMPEGTPVYGLEIGEKVSDGVSDIFNQFARFVANRLTFYDSNGNKVSWISDKKLHIKSAEITVGLARGGLVDTVLSDGSVVTK